MYIYDHIFFGQFFLECEVIQTKNVENIKTRFIFRYFFPKIVPFMK
jgi:hypothetical protein